MVMRDGSLRAVIMVSSINFSLKSEEEQEAIISSYVRFLNSVDFPIEIVVQSRKLYIEPYLEEMKKKQEQMKNDLLAIQMADYRDFVRELVELGDIMVKKFYIVVPYTPGSGKYSGGFFARLGDLFSAAQLIHISKERFEKFRNDLYKRVDYVMSQLNAMGIKGVALDTQSLIELAYESFNPVIANTQKLEDAEKVRME